MPGIDEQVEVLMSGTAYGDPQTKEHMTHELRERLIQAQREGRPLRVYCGYDPRKPDLHLGHTITMRKLRQFQEFGHDVIFLIGTFTSLIGDPSDVDKAREQLTPEQAEENARTYQEQAFKILDPERTEVRRNDEWLSSLDFRDIIRLAQNFTVQQFLTRENFARRLEQGEAIYLHEMFYSLMQAYDAVALRADVQVGGQDQLFNILVAGRKLQQAVGMPPLIAIIMGELLPGTDGEVKMSKSMGNHIPLLTTPEDMYGKVMSVPDKAMPVYHKLLLGWNEHQLDALKARMATEPMQVKKELAHAIVSIFMGEEAAAQGARHFATVIQGEGLPDEMPSFTITAPARIVDILAGAGLTASKNDAKRQITGGGVRLDGERVTDFEAEIAPDQAPAVLQVGKRKFVRVVAG
ncbi:MAG: tyrosine--tRNA ligase [Chloroflexota bacterium]|jgi:tyrosyl-tRNA synthetase|nr:tyrosine--tRNA ligase [Aggregatilineaceae bacterium]